MAALPRQKGRLSIMGPRDNHQKPTHVEVITIPINMPREEPTAFAELLKRTSYDDCLRRSNRLKRYSDGREEVDVMWAGLRLVESQFADAGFSPR